MKKEKILNVDHGKDTQEEITQYFKSEGYEVIEADTGEVALERLRLTAVDLVLMAPNLPDIEGFELIPKIREQSDAGIIIISDKDDPAEKVLCLEMGADNYVTKPLNLRTLMARVRALRRRIDMDEGGGPDNENSPQKIYFNDGWVLDCNQYQLFDRSGETVELTTGQFKILEALALSPHRALSRERLFELTRGDEFEAYDRAVDVQISKLRKKIAKGDDSRDIIKTVRGVGYMFCADTRCV